MEPRVKGVVSLIAGASLLAASLGCGTIMYPERRGQKGGRIGGLSELPARFVAAAR